MEKGGLCLFVTVSFVVLFMQNAVIIMLINASALYVNMRSSGEPLGALDYLGVLVWLVGFAILAVSDH